MTLPRFLAAGLVLAAVATGTAGTPRLSTPGASPEAEALYQFLLGVSGKHTLSGQHCVPLVGDTRLPALEKGFGHYPAVFSQDFGFSEPGTWDGINYRQRIVDDAIRRHSEGFIINLMWHAVRPTEDEPVEFTKSIQGKLTDAEWRELLTPGTRLHERWQSQVDVIAFFLRQLRDARVPVLWRPYHEMNGRWFWWGGRPGPEDFTKLYRMLHDRLVNFHGLKNLIWVYGPNEVRENVAAYADFFPGHDVVDALATDVYSGGFAPHDYDTLLALAAGKPIGLGEVGPIPTVETLKSQPRWAWFVAWHDLLGAPRESHAAIKATFDSPETMNWAELPWVKVRNPTVHYPVIR
jgi:mannan endo-1,4-beta-mannosidase